jgi:hypothetical protein
LLRAPRRAQQEPWLVFCSTVLFGAGRVSDGSPIPEVDQVAQLNRTVTQALRTPVPVSADSDGVVLALETARALEARGDMSEAAKWLRRAAREAESHGDDVRVLHLAHVAADMASAISHPPLSAVPPPVRGSEPSDSSEATIRQTDFPREALQVMSNERPVAESTSPMKTIPDDDDSSTPTMVPPRVDSNPIQHARSGATPPSISTASGVSISVGRVASESLPRISAIRVALKRTTSTAKSYSLEVLDPGQPSPAGTIEAMLIVPSHVGGRGEGGVEQAGKRTPPKR